MDENKDVKMHKLAMVMLKWVFYNENYEQARSTRTNGSGNAQQRKDGGKANR